MLDHMPYPLISDGSAIRPPPHVVKVPSRLHLSSTIHVTLEATDHPSPPPPISFPTHHEISLISGFTVNGSSRRKVNHGEPLILFRSFFHSRQGS